MTLREFALKYDLDPQELFEILVFENFPIAGIEDSIDDRVAEYLLEYVDNKKAVKKQKGIKKIDPKKGYERGSKQPEGSFRRERKEAEAKTPLILPLRPMTLGEFAQLAKMQTAQIISYWLQKGKMYPLHHELTVSELRELAEHFAVSLEEKREQEVALSSAHARHGRLAKSATVQRKPVVVVVGHVDHGKTSLLDYIRKTAVASHEKGGITQHIGAYKAQVPGYGEVVFIDTPGHEAFTAMREQGLAVADVAVLVVAADDGVKPQTIEAIRVSQALGITIVVALNKVDRVGQKEIDKVYQQLAEYGLTPEAWGGSTTCVHISALTGQGIPELLEVISLAAEVLDLRANMNVPAAGYILEAKQEKGRGVVATVILQHGVLAVGDSFYAGSSYGRVMSLVDSNGKNLQEVQPSDPVQVSGFDELPSVGSVFCVAPMHEAKEKAYAAFEQARAKTRKELSGGAAGTTPLNIILKADTSSSLQALVSSIAKSKGKGHYSPVVVASSIGLLNESDLDMAETTKSIIYMLHVHPDAEISTLAKQKALDIRHFDIIYDLLEDLRKLTEKPKEPKVKEKKLGDAVVLKVFALKNQNVIAGIRVTSGLVKPGVRVIVWRNKNKIFSGGPVRSLQKERQDIKEAGKGHECAFLIEKFSDWAEGDIVEFFQDVVI